MERTLVLIKPDAMERKLMGEIISIYEKSYLHIAVMKIIKPTIEIAKEHYIEHKEKPFFKELIDYITRGELCALIVEGENAVEEVRKINGATDPKNADSSSIRGRFALSKSENSVHASDSPESAEREIRIWFPETIQNNVIKEGKKYRHFKGNEYLMLHIAKHSETEEEMVVYQALYGERGIWVRPLSMFLEKVEKEGKIIDRFKEIIE